MSYDIELVDPITKEPLELDAPHHMRGGTYAVGGTTRLHLNVTYNYAPIFSRVLKDGIRGIYGKSGAETLPIFDAAIKKLGDDITGNYWDATEGNAKQALIQLRALACMRPDGIWSGD